MPSINHIILLAGSRRLRVNVCEGQVHVIRESADSLGKWSGANVIGPLSLVQAAELADLILSGIKKDQP